ncbi:MAG TPA: aminotransferase class V-fold PLP-dependent enzyme [Phycisphaerae bacterium]|nr:aminotransferase class V-fold PLP-dependent enzyme [Phycisphaerae bacterium]
MTSRLYLDNAATSFPKPPEVFEAMRRYAEELGASAGRGAYREALASGELVADCRRRLATLINAPATDHVVFTHNCSTALNQAIKGYLRKGDHVVTSRMEHNSVLRPLQALSDEGLLEVTHAPADCETGRVDAADLLAAIRPRTKLIVLAHASNVTGTLQPIEAVGAEAQRRGIPFLVDAAQTAGHVLIDVQAMKIDLLAIPGHKGLLGPLGTGALYIRPGLEGAITPLVQGGTGSVSERPVQPDFMPDKFESGSHNAIGLAGLAAALQWIEDQSIESLAAHDRAVCARFLQKARELPGLVVYGPQHAEERVGVFSVRLSGLEPGELSALLETEFGILTRSGLHCAPMAHETIGTHTDGGTTRISFGAFNTPAHIDFCVEALGKLSDVAVSR